MDYQQTLDYLYSQLPMFYRIGPVAYKANLNNIIELAQRLGNPQNSFKSIHIAGTNGKGSVAHMLASIFQEAGYKTGLCTSPHLKDFRERFRINGQMMPKEFVASFVSNHKSFFSSLQPSFFEMTIAMTFDFFARENIDIGIIETGLGGRLDSTNIITPELSVITNIGFDHMNLLGNTLEAIAGEKAGIIKPGVPVVVGQYQDNTAHVFVKKARETGSDIVFATNSYHVTRSAVKNNGDTDLLHAFILGNMREVNVECALTGSYQLENLCTVLSAVDAINKGGRFYLSEEHVLFGLKNVITNTGIMGRWQKLSKEPLVICDTGHNEDGIRQVMENIRRTPHEHLHFVLGIMNDKDIDGVLKLLPQNNATYYFCSPDVPRGLDSSILRQAALQKGLNGDAYLSVKIALEAAKQAARACDLVFVGGSTFVVAEVV
jgi:dihydrofolate synthase / folylpolyglutamate synthase